MIDKYGRTIVKTTSGGADVYTITVGGGQLRVAYPSGTADSQIVQAFNGMAPAGYEEPFIPDPDSSFCQVFEIDAPTNTPTLTLTQSYRVGTAKLEIHLNGQALILDRDFTEVGVPGSFSFQFQMAWNLIAGDVVHARIR